MMRRSIRFWAFLLSIAILVGISVVKPSENLRASGPEKVGIYTNSFGYYVLVTDPVQGRLLKYSNDGIYLGVVVPTVSTHITGERWTLKNPVDVVTCRLTDVLGLADPVTGHSYIYELDGHTHHKNGNPGTGPGKTEEMWGVAMTEIDEVKSQALLDRKGSKINHWAPPPGGIKDPRDGIWLRDFGSRGSGNGQLMLPEGMVYRVHDLKHELYVADTGNNRVVVFGLTGTFVRNIGSAGTGNGQFREPIDVDFDFHDAQGDKMYILERGNKRISVFDRGGRFVRHISLSALTRPSSQTIDVDNNIWVTDPPGNRAFKFDQTGKHLLTINNLINPPNVNRTIVRVYIGKFIMTVNDIAKAIDAPPYIDNSRTMVPLRAISEGLGAKVEWNDKERKVTITLGNKRVELWIDNPTGRIDGKSYPMPDGVAPTIRRSRTFVPVRFVAEGLGAAVSWNPRDLKFASGAVSIIYPK
jgi:hypothetical protein